MIVANYPKPYHQSAGQLFGFLVFITSENSSNVKESTNANQMKVYIALSLLFLLSRISILSLSEARCSLEDYTDGLTVSGNLQVKQTKVLDIRFVVLIAGKTAVAFVEIFI